MTATALTARSSLHTAIAGHPMAAFLAIAFASTWVLTLLVPVSLVFGLVALFGPTLAAVVVSRADGTWPDLRARILGWRRHLGWYALAFCLPFLVAGLARLIHTAAGGASLGIGAISAIEVVLFVLVIGEEIGWRGFLQPRLRERMSLAAAGLAVGVAWTLWHVALYLVPEVRLADFAVFAWWVIPMAVVIGTVAEGARFSVMVATVMHGAANIAAPILLPGVDRTWTLLVTGAIYLVVALAIVAGSRFRADRALLGAGLVVVAGLLAGCATASGGAATPAPTAPTGTVAVEMQDYAFVPADLEVEAGTTVAFVNTGVAPHTATADGSFDTGEVKAGGVATLVLETPGTYDFLCTYHPQMTGTITVAPATAEGSPSPSVEPTAAPSEPGAEPTPGRSSVALEQTTPHEVTVEVIDWTGAVATATSGTPGDGASVPNETLVIANEDPQTLRLTWAGGPCDATDTVVLDADGRTITVISEPCVGDAIAFDRVLILRLATPLDAAGLEARFQAGGDTPG